MPSKSLKDPKDIQNETTEPTEFLILDFSEAKGIDATSARSCFLMLVQLMRSAGVTVAFAALTEEMRALLMAHGVIRGDTDIVISNIDDALEWCEDQILGKRPSNIREESGIERGRDKECSLERGRERGRGKEHSLNGLRKILQEHLEIEEEEETDALLSPHSLLHTESLKMFFKREEVTQGGVVFDVGDKADKVFFIESGSVNITLSSADKETGRGGVTTNSKRVNKISSGGIFGEAAFFLDLPHSADAPLWGLVYSGAW
eukprot:CAMPEP_0119039864 /NCGR_PEP_ID=MMETSP1177-20130426/9593_1 /TAXON_ID=2985 /ORGANISM="Ochromonas sp, Strain CCMP1899" /LENGTH=260 /DNA_ID=CAMNT_0007004295 /DNA_START=156 /DNA_END=936 /DNA_ORIENTATION=+